MQKLQQFIIGFGYYIKAIVFFTKHPVIWLYMILPGFVAFITADGIWTLYRSYEQSFWGDHKILRWIISILPDAWEAWVERFIIYSTVGLLALLLMILMNFLSAPAQRALSMKTEEAKLGYPPKVKSLSFFEELLGKFILVPIFGLTAIVVLCLCFVPVIGQIIGFFWVSYQTAFSYVEFVLIRKGLSYWERKKRAMEYRWLLYGFGAASILILLIPPLEIPLQDFWLDLTRFHLSRFQIKTIGLSIAIFAIPWSVIGGTLLALEQLKKKTS